MTRKPRSRRQQEALYRFLVIGPLLSAHMSPKERSEAIARILLSPPRPPDGGPVPPLSRRTIQRWLATYRKAEVDRLASLEPKVRKDWGTSRKVDPDLLVQATALRAVSPRLSLKSILQRIEHPKRDSTSRRTLGWSFLQAGYDRRDKRRRILERDGGGQRPVNWDLESWEADFPNALWQVDSTPSIWLAAGRHREKAVHLQLVNLIDDHSRLIVGGGFVERLRVVDLLSFLVPAIGRYGCPAMLFMDQAKIHKSAIVTMGLPRLGGAPVFGTVGHAPGHGKIERLHQQAQDTLEEDLRRSPVETVEEATRFHEIWREHEADEVHSQTHETPRTRWARIEGNARIPSAEELLWAFRGEKESARIDEVGAIRLHGRVYEAPASHRKGTPRNVRVRFDLLDRSAIWIEDDDGTHHACPLYRVRSHTERRTRHPGPQKGLSFRSLFEEERAADEDTPKED